MSRIRTIKPEFWGHAKVSRVSRDARLLFLGLLNESDDEGRLLGSAKRLAGVVFPYDVDVTAKKIERWLSELAGVCLVHRYVVDGAPYIFLPGFTDHQKISHPSPSRLPNFSGAPPELFAPDLGRDLGMEWKGDSLGVPPEAPDPILVQKLVGGFIDDYRAERDGHNPPDRFKGACGTAVKTALKDKESPEDIARCLGVIAHEGKNPNSLAYVLGDYHAGRPRRRL